MGHKEEFKGVTNLERDPENEGAYTGEHQLGDREWNQTNFWSDPWINGKSIRQLVPEILVLPQESAWAVANFITKNRTWDIDLLHEWLPPEVVNLIPQSRFL